MNCVQLVGNLGADPETRTTNSGTAVMSLRVATSERRKVDGTWTKVSEWHSVVVWDKQAEALGRFLKKGHKVAVSGRLHTRSWEKDGQKRYKTEIVAQDVEMLTPKGEQRPTGHQQGTDQGGNFDQDDIGF